MSSLPDGEAAPSYMQRTAEKVAADKLRRSVGLDSDEDGYWDSGPFGPVWINGKRKTQSAESDPWPEPVNLWQRYDAPEMPVDLLPEPIADFAKRQSIVMGCDPAGLAMSALTVCAAAITDEIALQVKRHDSGWRESARLWTGLVGAPSMKKTPTMNAAIRNFRKIDGALARTYQEKRAAYEKLTAKERKEAEQPKQERRIISDTTVEAAQEVLKDSPRGVLSAQDELSGWFGQMDKYAPGKGAMADRSFWLQAFNGGPYSYNRIGRGSGFIPNCAVCLLGGIQPEPLRAIASDAQDDGLIQRLIPVILRPGRVGKDIPAGSEAQGYDRLIERLELMRAEISDKGYPRPLMLDDDARALREELEGEHMDLVRSLESVSPKLASHFGKYDGLFARLCVLWHCIENCASVHPPRTISLPTAKRVAAFMEQFIRPSAIAFYAGILGLSAGHDDVMAIASYIVAKKLDEVTARDVQRSGQTFRHTTADQVRVLCEKLEAFGWLDKCEPAPKSSTPRWIVNPNVHTMFAEQGRRESERREKAREALRDALQG